MRKVSIYIILLFSICLVTSVSSAQSKKPTKSNVADKNSMAPQKSHSLSDQLKKKSLVDFLLTKEQLQKLSYKEQVSYMTFLINLVAIIERSENSNSYKKKSASLDNLEFNNLLQKLKRYASSQGFIFDSSLLNNANAFPPMGLLFTGSKDCETNNSCKQEVDNDQESFWSSFLSSMQAQLEGRTAFGSESKWESQRPSGRYGNGSSRTDEYLPASGPIDDTPSSYRKPGATCLFGGHVSEYYENANGEVKCKAKGFHDKSCPTPQSQVKCYGFDMGFSASDLCVDASDLNNLTKNCVTKLKASLDEMRDRASTGNNNQAVSKSAELEYNKFIEELKEKVREFEKEHGGKDGISVQEYCADDNKVNDSLQKETCESVLTLVAAVEQTGLLKYIEPPKPVIAKPEPSPFLECQMRMDDLRSCTQCGMSHSNLSEPSDRFMELVEAMAVQCYKDSSDVCSNKKTQQRIVANYIANVGHCNSYEFKAKWGKLDKSDQKEIDNIANCDHDIWNPKFLSGAAFHRYFGISLDAAKEAFCSTPYGDLDKGLLLQQNFNKAIEKEMNKKSSTGLSPRRQENAGWNQCLAEIKREQSGRRNVSQLVKNLTEACGRATNSVTWVAPLPDVPNRSQTRDLNDLGTGGAAGGK